MNSQLKWKQKFNNNLHHIDYLFVCSLSLAAIAYFVNENVLGSGKDQITDAHFSDNKYSVWYMPFLSSISPILSFTSGGAAGIFAPRLSAGASLGSVFSGLMHFSESDSNLMILAGMVAFLSDITQAPFTSSILVLEMTDRKYMILHLMAVVIVSSVVSIAVDQRSMYKHLKNHYKFSLAEEEIEESKSNENNREAHERN